MKQEYNKNPIYRVLYLFIGFYRFVRTVSASQLSRIVSGETRTVSSDILIGVAKEFKVSTDYILGLSTVSVRKSYDISELGLSEGAVRGLVTGAVDVQILNRLLEHRNFPKLIDLIRIYFQDTAAKGITARNQLIEIATASLSDLMKEHPEHRAEAKQDLQLLNAQKMGEHEAEIEKIKNVFLAILRDIKKDIDNGEQPGEAVTAAMFQAMRDALAEQKQNPLSIEYELSKLVTPDGKRILAEGIHLKIKGSEKICMIGANGAGKTTLLKKIAEELLNRNDIKAEYMPQTYEDLLDLDVTPVDYLDKTGDKEERTRIRTYLGSLKYTPDEMEHPIRELSGGQKAKVLLLRMSLSGANVLILDEPTRNFSPLSGPVIRKMLREFPGAVISISHDRKYIEEVCDKIYQLNPNGLQLIGD